MSAESSIILSDDEKTILKVDNSLFDASGEYVIPDTVECVGKLSFHKCDKLKKLVIPSSVKRIEPQAFYLCSNLTEVTLSDSLEYVGLEAFSYCAINTLKIAEDTKRITALMDITQDIDFRPDDMKIELGLIDEQGLPLKNKNILTKIIVPDSITHIEDYAFKDCDQAEIVNYAGESVVLTDKIKSIGRYAFYNTSYYNTEDSVLYIDGHLIDANIDEKRHASEAYEIPDGIKTIADSAFRNCPGLTSVIIPKSVDYIGNNAFRNCQDLEIVVIRSAGDEGVYENQLVSLDGLKLYDSDGLALLAKPEESGNDAALYETYSLYGEVKRPERLGTRVFDYCGDNLTIYCSGDILTYLESQGKHKVDKYTNYNKN